MRKLSGELRVSEKAIVICWVFTRLQAEKVELTRLMEGVSQGLLIWAETEEDKIRQIKAKTEIRRYPNSL